MTNNMDEFDHDGPEELGPEQQPGGGERKPSLIETWKSRPIVKLVIIMAVVGAAIAGALGVFSGKPEGDHSQLVRPPQLNEPPGGQASPYFVEQNKMASSQRAEEALQGGGSAIPTPSGPTPNIDELTNTNKDDPLHEFRMETERLRKEQQQSAQQIETLQQQLKQPAVMPQPQQPAPPPPDDNSLAQAMQKQMQQMMESWTPRGVKVVAGQGLKEATASAQAQGTAGAAAGGLPAPSPTQAQAPQPKTIVPAGTVNYAQLLVEANSDVPSPILAQILSGPLAGGKAIGSFQVLGDYLVMQFSLVNLKGKDYPVNILALDPDTTLSGMATEVDHRYFSRVLLPAAAQFVSTFGSTLGQGGTSTTVTDNAVLVEQAKRGYNEALYAGLGQVGQTLGQFMQQQAAQIRPLVRVAPGTPMGMFFLASVKENSGQPGTQPQQQPNAEGGLASLLGGNPVGGAIANAYRQQPYPGQGGYNPYGTPAGMGYAPSYAGAGFQPSPGGGVTVIAPGQQQGLGTISYYGR